MSRFELRCWLAESVYVRRALILAPFWIVAAGLWWMSGGCE